MILDDIVEARRGDLERAKKAVSFAELEKTPLYREKRRGFGTALARGGRAIIAEVKKASPSRGVIREDFDPVALARRYAECGAAAISVLTEERHFQGSLRYLADIRGAVGLPLLRKDFLVDSYQVVEARAWGADAVLLIVAILDDPQLKDLLAAARDIDLDVLMEAHTEEEVDRAVVAGARIIGVNNRDLRTFVTTLETAVHLRPRIPAGSIAVAESGIDAPADVTLLEEAGFNVFLIGEALMRAPDPGVKLAALLAAER
jgi:indole-3-glycerol phosphate synthase